MAVLLSGRGKAGTMGLAVDAIISVGLAGGKAFGEVHLVEVPPDEDKLRAPRLALGPGAKRRAVGQHVDGVDDKAFVLALEVQDAL
jgi:hypothetical protein